MSQPHVIAALYKFAPIADPEALRPQVQVACEQHGVTGTLLLAREGLNGTISSTREGLDGILAYLRSLPGFATLEHKEALSHDPPFHRMKVRLKKEIVTMGVEGIDPNDKVGTYLSPAAWNELLEDPEVVLVDTRNDYEVRIGTFEGAIDPDIASFRDFPRWVDENLDPQRHKKVAMFCTGGIRCEKATSLLLEKGFEEVFHLRGGILKYFEEVPTEHSKWEGECFVFDQRVSVDQDLQPGRYGLCFGCQEPVSPEDMQDPRYEEGVCCARCHAATNDDMRARRRERMKQVELSAERGERHIGS